MEMTFFIEGFLLYNCQANAFIWLKYYITTLLYL